MSSNRQAVKAPKAPKPKGNYSHAVRLGNTLHVCGWMGDDPRTGEIVSGGIQPQTVRYNFTCIGICETNALVEPGHYEHQGSAGSGRFIIGQDRFAENLPYKHERSRAG